jgi:hypothetical protein
MDLAYRDILLRVYSFKLRSAALMVAACAACFPNGAHSIERISISAARLKSENFEARKVSATLRLRAANTSSGELRVSAAEFRARQDRWRDVEFGCAALQLSGERIACAQAELRSEKMRMPLAFTLTAAPRLTLALKPEANELWQLDADLSSGALQGELKLANAQVARAADWLDAAAPRPNAGRADGTFALRSTRAGAAQLTGDLAFKEISFSDEAAARIGEALAGRISLNADTERGNAWRFRGSVDVSAGELLWSPLYLQQTPSKLAFDGALQEGALRELRLTAQLAGIGALDAALDAGAKGGTLNATNIDLAGLYAALGKQLLEQPGGTQYEVSGRGDLDLRYGANGVERAKLRLRDAAFADTNARLRLSGIQADVPWVMRGQSQGSVRIKSGALWGVPLANIDAQARMNGFDVHVPRLTVDVLDGIFALNDLRARRANGAWRWDLTAGLTPVSLEKLSKQLGWPQLSGSLSGVVPRLHYANNTIGVDGNVMFNVFGGSVLAQNLSMQDPLGGQPIVAGDVQMRKLDLGVLTRTYSFGHISGFIDVDVKGAQLRNWKPVRFDARVVSSDGNYPRRISQQAVQNLSSLGGAGATAALQRSLLRFFETFRYKRLGLTCELRESVCKMGGVASAPQGYVIVEGGGIPAITVIGYNQSVSWQELLARVRRVTQGNSKAVVK